MWKVPTSTVRRTRIVATLTRASHEKGARARFSTGLARPMLVHWCGVRFLYQCYVDDMLIVGTKCDMTTVAKARDGDGNTLGHDGGEASGVLGTILEQNDRWVHLRRCWGLRETVVHRLLTLLSSRVRTFGCRETLEGWLNSGWEWLMKVQTDAWQIALSGWSRYEERSVSVLQTRRNSPHSWWGQCSATAEVFVRESIV